MPAFVDATRIAQIIGNLLNNASKHSPPGARDPRRAALRQERGRVIRVIDRRRGHSAPISSTRVFDMFTKIERTVPSANDGLGIGLALSRQLASCTAGRSPRSSEGEGLGATFTLSLPARHAHRRNHR